MSLICEKTSSLQFRNNPCDTLSHFRPFKLLTIQQSIGIVFDYLFVFPGFGGPGFGQDILAGGLFEGGSLFDDAPPSMPPSERVPPSESIAFGDDNYDGMPSPGVSSGGGSRPPTPMDTESHVSDREFAPTPQVPE